jgi:hypothetical protein
MDENIVAGPSSPQSQARGYRSRRTRPCDRCKLVPSCCTQEDQRIILTGRRGKQLCLITVPGNPCGGCLARKQSCTFEQPPLKRHRESDTEKSLAVPINPGLERSNHWNERGSANTYASVSPTIVRGLHVPECRDSSSSSHTTWTGGFSQQIMAASTVTFGPRVRSDTLDTMTSAALDQLGPVPDGATGVCPRQ